MYFTDVRLCECCGLQSTGSKIHNDSVTHKTQWFEGIKAKSVGQFYRIKDMTIQGLSNKISGFCVCETDAQMSDTTSMSLR